MLHIEPTKSTMKSIAACATSKSTRGHFDVEVQADASTTDAAAITKGLISLGASKDTATQVFRSLVFTDGAGTYELTGSAVQECHRLQLLRRALERPNFSSMNLAEHKWLGRCMVSAPGALHSRKTNIACRTRGAHQ
jgi:hypothetical protein